MLKGIFATLAVLVSAARAEGSVGVVVSGDAVLQPSISAQIATWMQEHGHRVDAAALPPDAVSHLVDCFVLEDAACARKLVSEQAHTDAIVYARIDSTTSGAKRSVTLSLFWITKDRAPEAEKTECSSCTADTLKITTDAMLTSLKGTAAATAAAPAPAPAPAAPAPAVTTTATVTAEPTAQHGLAIGAELGEPTSATVGFYTGSIGLLAALGSGTREGMGIQFHADVQAVVARLAPDMPIRAGLGGRVYHHGYDRASIDELPDTHYGVRASVAIAKESKQLQLYAEVAPGVDLKKTNSCALTNGAYSICPHAQESPFFLQLVIGARWFLSH